MCLINIASGRRKLTDAGQKAFVEAYNSFTVFPGLVATICIPNASAKVGKIISELRRRNWGSSSHWTSDVEWIGLAGELAVWKFFGYSAEEALTFFLEGLKGTDDGADLRLAGMGFDVKTTRSNPVKTKISKTNKNRNEADAFIFAHLEESGIDNWIRLLGWSHRADVKPYLRDGGKCWFVRPESLRRAGLLKPLATIIQSSETVIPPLSTVNQ
jgi:hypothetical protein